MHMISLYKVRYNQGLRINPLNTSNIYIICFYIIIGKVKANFLRHEGYLGAIGAFLQGCDAELGEMGTGDQRLGLTSGNGKIEYCYNMLFLYLLLHISTYAFKFHIQKIMPCLKHFSDGTCHSNRKKSKR